MISGLFVEFFEIISIWKSQNPADVKDTLTGSIDDVHCHHFKVLLLKVYVFLTDAKILIELRIAWSYLTPLIRPQMALNELRAASDLKTLIAT